MSSTQSGIGQRRLAARNEGNEEYRVRRQELIRAAATVFREKGYEAATLNDVATRFGTDRASLYYYVGSKEELFQEAVRGVLDTNLKVAEGILRRRADVREKLHALIEQMITSYEENYPYTYLYIQEDMQRVGHQESEWARDMTRQTRRIVAIAVNLIDKGIEEGLFRADVDSQLAANALFGMLNWTHRWHRPGRDVTAAQMTEAFYGIFVQGMESRGS